jgi:EpsI family protein
VEPDLQDDAPTAAEVQPGLTRRHMVIGGALAVTSAIALVRQPEVTVLPLKEGTLEKLIPTQIGRWRFETKSGLVLPPEDPLSDSLYSDILTRVYVSENAPPIMFLIAYSNTQDGMLQLHRPEVCYPAGGFNLSETRVMPVDLDKGTQIAARYFSAESAARTEQILYWTRIGTEAPTSWLGQRTAIMRANLKGVIPDGILVRISSVLPDYQSARPVLEEFVAALSQELSPAARKLLISG